MKSDHSQPEDRDLVLAPGEYAYLQGDTNGRVGVGVGPCTINQTGQDRPVTFNPEENKFSTCSLTASVRHCPIAREGEYIVLENPSSDENNFHPNFDETDRQNGPKLKTGSKINLPGPITFALWPGQIAKVISGHRLRSNQFLVIRIYNEEQAKNNWDQAVFASIGETSEGETDETDKTDEGTGSIQADTSVEELELTIGKLFVIKGTQASFYIPPTGVEVVPEEGDKFVRDAVTLERLEHTILVDEDGNKRYRRGPDVVFPSPTETFVEQGGKRKNKAIELHSTQGIHVKVIEEYGEGDDKNKEGDELFIKGTENPLYFPRKEHNVIQYGSDPKHYALQIPKGEGRYVLNREQGSVTTVKGPKMLLPDPRYELVVRRVLSQGQCNLMYPDNPEAAAYNAELEEMMETTNSGRSGLVSEKDFARKTTSNYSTQQLASSKGAGEISDELENAGRRTRRQQRKGPKSIVVGSKFDNVPSIDLWTGYAVKVVSKTGERRVEIGPQTILLDYDENLEVLELSTGKPKNTDMLQPTVYLRVSNNKVTDILTVETSDNIEVEIKVAYRVNFDESMKDHWFDVENYVKLLCDHTRSILKTATKNFTIQEFYTNGMAVIRDLILNKVKNPEDETEEKTGLYFSENGMRVNDVEVLDLHLKDDRISEILDTARKDVVVQNIAMDQKKRELELTQESEKIKKATLEAVAETTKFKSGLDVESIELNLATGMADIESREKQEQAKKEIQIASEAINDVTHQAELQRTNDKTAALQQAAEKVEELRASGVKVDSEALINQFKALDDGFTEALTALSRDDVVVKIAEATSIQSMIGGKSAVEVITKILGGSERLKPFLDAVTKGAQKGAGETTSRLQATER